MTRRMHITAVVLFAALVVAATAKPAGCRELQGAQSAADDTASTASNAVEAVQNGTSNAGNTVADTAKDAANAVADGASSAANTVGDTASDAFNNVKDAFQGASAGHPVSGLLVTASVATVALLAAVA
jgi:phage-related protein